MATPFETLVVRLEAAVERLESVGKVSSVPTSLAAKSEPVVPVSAGVSSSVTSYQELLDVNLLKLRNAADKVGGQVLDATKILESAFKAELRVVQAIAQCKKPGLEDMQKLVQPVGEAMGKASALTEGRRTDSYVHLKSVAEGLLALTWVLYTGKDCGMSLPAAHVEESWDSAQFFANKVLVEYKSKDPSHVEWVKALKELFVPGLRGPPPPKFSPSSAPASGANSGAAAAVGMSKVFAELNRGENVTSGLKKVTDDMKTKNRSERSGAVPASISTSAAATGAETRPAQKVVAAPKLELQQGRKWVIENQVDNKSIVISETEARQTVYIFNCRGSVIQVQGKVNNITLDKCTKTGIVFQDVVAACEIVNCTSVEVQCQGTAPTIAVDNTNGCQLYLSATSVGAALTTAKSSEVNVLVPGASPKDDLVEHALPEQFLNIFQDGHFVTTSVSHSGG
eukprot:jgi/Mesen1/3732/ME000203S02821